MDEINLRGEALAGVTFAFVLFVAYWLLAGPVGFAMLRSAKRTRHAWVAFAAVSAIFTAVAWGGVQLFSRKDVQVQHFTVLDVMGGAAQLPGEPAGSTGPAGMTYRASSWFTVFLPGYGSPRLEIESAPGVRNVLSSFAPPGVDQTRFRNVDHYTIPFDSPDAYQVPARSTTKEMYARWMGDAPDESFGNVFEIISPLGLGRRGTLYYPTGEIGHNLPGSLRNVDITLIEPRRTVQPRYRDGSGVNPVFRVIGSRADMLSAAQMWSLPGEWKPHTPITLEDIQQSARFDLFLNRLRDDLDRERTSAGITSRPDFRRRYIETLSFFLQMPPPSFTKQPNDFGMEPQPVFERHLGRELDLSPWFTRPCLIITGWLENAEMPVPLRVGGYAPASRGLTYVRFIYPLPVSVDDVKASEPEPEPEGS